MERPSAEGPNLQPESHFRQDIRRLFERFIFILEKWIAAYTRSHGVGRFKGMKLRKRHKIVILFWVPFWSLTLGTCVLAGWAFGAIRF